MFTDSPTLIHMYYLMGYIAFWGTGGLWLSVVLRDLVRSGEQKPAVVINGVLCTEGLCQGHLM